MMNKEQNFELDIFLNKRVLRNLFCLNIAWPEDLENKIEEKKEQWLKEKIFKLKESILYNNLDSSYLSSINLDLSNLYYFKHFLKILKDFESVDYDNLQKLRISYLTQFFEKIDLNNQNLLSLQKEIPESLTVVNEKIFMNYIEQNSKKLKRDDIIALISALISVIMSDSSPDTELKYKIISRMLENLRLEIEKMFDRSLFENSLEIEKNLLLLLDTFNSRFVSTDDKSCAEIIRIYQQFQQIALRFESTAMFVKVLHIFQDQGISLSNYSKIAEEYFKQPINPLRIISTENEDPFKVLTYEANNEISFYSYTSDDNYIFLITLSTNAATKSDVTMNLIKIGSGFGNTLANKVYLERTINLEKGNNSSMPIVRVANSHECNEIKLIIAEYKGREIRVITINKDTFNFKNERKVKFPNEKHELISIFHSENHFYFFLAESLSSSDTVSQMIIEDKPNEPVRQRRRSIPALIRSDSATFSPIAATKPLAEEGEKVKVPVDKKDYYMYTISDSYELLLIPLNLAVSLQISDFPMPIYEQTFFSYGDEYIFIPSPSNNEKKSLLVLKIRSNSIQFLGLENNGKPIPQLPQEGGYMFNIDHNCLINSQKEGKSKIKFGYYANKFSAPFINMKHCSDVIKTNKGILNKAFEKSNSNLFQKRNSITEFFNQKSMPTESEYKIDKALSTAYVSFLYAHLVKYISYFGNFKNSFKQHLASMENKESAIKMYETIYTKTFSNNLSSVELFDMMLSNLSNSNKTILEYSIVILQSMLTNLIDINVDIAGHLPNLPKLVKILFALIFDNTNCVSEPPCLRENVYQLISIIILNSKGINSYEEEIRKIMEMVHNEKIDMKSKIIYLNLVLDYWSKSGIEIELIEHVLKFEEELLENFEDSCKEENMNMIYAFASKFKKKFLLFHIRDILQWNLEEETSIISKLFCLCIGSLKNIIIHFIQKQNANISSGTSTSTCPLLSGQLMEFLNNYSIITHLTLLMVTTIAAKSENTDADTSKVFTYFTLVINLMIELDQFCSNKNCEFNLLENEITLFQTEHPCEADTRRGIEIIFPNSGDLLKYKFDSMSYMSNESSLSIDLKSHDQTVMTWGPYNTNFPTEEVSLKGIENVLMKYNPQTLSKSEISSNKADKLSNGFFLKFWNYENDRNKHESSSSILSDIRRSILFSICRVIKNTLLKPSESGIKESKRDMMIYKSLFSSKLLENISLMSKDQSMQNEYYEKIEKAVQAIQEDSNKKLKETCLTFVHNLKETGKEKKCDEEHPIEKCEEMNQINEIINMIKSNSDDYFKRGIFLLQKQFLLRNPWGNAGGKEIEHLVIFLFVIILKHEKLLVKYDEYLKYLNTEGIWETLNPGIINEIPNFIVFLKIFSECSKIRIWFNEMKMVRAEKITSEILSKAGEVGNDMLDARKEELIDEDVAMYLIKLRQKAEFLLNTLNISLEDESVGVAAAPISPRSTSPREGIKSQGIIPQSPRAKPKEKEFTQNIQDLIDNLLIYIKSEEIDIDKIIGKIKYQNSIAIKKETALICFNILLNILSSQQDIRDLIYWIHILFKDNFQSILIYFNHDLYGADSMYVERVKVQFYNFISIILDKIRISENTRFSLMKSHYDIMTHLTLSQSLIWKLKKRDYPFIKLSNFFEIFEKGSTISHVLKYIDQSSVTALQKRKEHYEVEQLDFKELHRAVYQIFSIYAFQVFDKFNDDVGNDSSTSTPVISPRGGAASVLSLKRKISELNEYESFKIINKISNVILNEFDNYVVAMREFIEYKDSSNLNSVSEEKLNSFLILLYRCLSFNEKLITYFMKNFGDILAQMLEMFLYTSDMNKLIIIKFFDIFTSIYDEEFMKNSIELFKRIIEKRMKSFCDFICSDMPSTNFEEHEQKEKMSFNLNKKHPHLTFYIHLLFKLAYILQNQQSFNQKFIFATESDNELSWEIIFYLRKLLLSNTIYTEEIQNFIQNILTSNFNHNLTCIVLTLVGAHFNPLRIGAKVVIDVSKQSKKQREYDIHEFNFDIEKPEMSIQNVSQKSGVIIGFISNPKNPFVIDEEILEFSFDQFSYSPKKYAIVTLEENLTKDKIKSLAFETMILESQNLDLLNENVINTSSSSKIQLDEVLFKTRVIELILQFLSQDSDKISKISSDADSPLTSPNILYLMLKLLKQTVFASNQSVAEYLYDLIGKPDIGEKLIKILSVLSLNGLDTKCKLVSLEALERKSTYEIFTITSPPEEGGTITKVSSVGSEESINQMLVSTSNKSIFLRFNGNLIKELPFLKIYNVDKLPKRSMYYPIQLFSQSSDPIMNPHNPTILIMESSLLSSDIFTYLENNKTSIYSIITNEQIHNKKDIVDKLLSELTIPIVSISDSDYYGTTAFLFEKVPNEEYEELFMQSIHKDFSSFLDIPPQMVDETVRFGQRDLVLKVVNEANPKGVTLFEESVPKNKKKQNTLNLQKLISLTSRRLLIFFLSRIPQARRFVDVKQILNIFKLLIFENNLISIEQENKSSSTGNATDTSKSQYSEIIQIIKIFLNSLTEKPNLSEWDAGFVSYLIDLSFMNKLNYIDYSLLANVDSERDLLSFENVENNLKVIFALLKRMNSLKNLPQIKEYEMKLFHALILKVNDFSIKNKKTCNFILEVMIILLKHIYSLIVNNDEQMKQTLKNYAFLFKSEEFLRLGESIKGLFDGKDINLLKIEDTDSKIVNFFIIFLDLAIISFTFYEIDLNLNYFLSSKVLNIYFAYSLMTKKFTSLEFFILFCQMRSIVPIKQPNLINYDFHYLDTQTESAHLMRFEYEFSDGINIKINNLQKDNLFDPQGLIFFYSDKDCTLLQDYINIEDNLKEKEIFIKNNSGNKFYISIPYTGFKHNIYACGKNDYQSLGCLGESGKVYTLPQKTVGLEAAKNIKDYKFGYYHCFVATTDMRLFVCGKDTASSLKSNAEYPQFTLENHLHDICQREGLVSVWVNNYNATIMLTKANNLYACGVNTDCCLSNATEIGSSNSIPYLMPNIEKKIISVACGYKSSIFVLEDGSAMTLGCNTYNECGCMEHTNILTEYYPLAPPDGCKIINAVAGEHFFLLLIKDKGDKIRLYSVGCNDKGRCGVDNDNSHRLQKCKGVENIEFKYLASRNYSSAAISKQGHLYTFGCGEENNLGHGNNNDYLRPTIVEALKDYIAEEVAISHNHMLVIARDRVKGEKRLFSCGTNEHGGLAFDEQNLKLKTPREVLFFKEKEPKQIPVRLALSRYQSYILTMDSKIADGKSYFNIECKLCNAYIRDVMYLRPSISNSEYANDFICENCVVSKIGSEILYLIPLPSAIANLKKLPKLMTSNEIVNYLNGSQENANDNMKAAIYGEEEMSGNEHYKFLCADCLRQIPPKEKVYFSADNPDLVLCLKCIDNKCNKIEYPQVFYAMNKIRLARSMLNKLPKVDGLSSLLWNIIKTEKPYLSLEISPKMSQLDELTTLSRDKAVLELFAKWKQLRNSQLIQLNMLRDEIDTESKDNAKILSDNAKIFEYLQTHCSEDSRYHLLSECDYDHFSLLCQLSVSINECIFYLMNLTYSMKEKGFLHEAIADNLSLVSSKSRLNIFHDRLDKLKTSVNPGQKDCSLNRMKAMKFYEKKIVDTLGENTIFGQLYHKMKTYPIANYLCKKDNRLFVVSLTGEGATDYGGPYRDVLSMMCDELHSPYLDLFIKAPNNRNEVGALRDKYVPNPNAKSALHMDMYFFIGCMIGYAISSGQLMNLNIHPVIWQLMLNQSAEFSEIETIDKLFYKYIIDIEKANVTQTRELDAYFMIQLSDSTEYELIPNGKKIQVTPENKEKFISLAKRAKLDEFKVQVDSIRYGLINVIPDNIFSILTGKEAEELACGKPTLNVEILKQHTEYQSYRQTDTIILNFWKALESFTNDEKVSYLKYVWGRTRLPDPNIFPFVHVISKMSHSQPDSRLPSATTCYFTLKLPDYSSYDILVKKLKYVINNCSEIDADFAVSSTPDI